MTMKRNDKTAAMRKTSALFDGSLKIVCYSPKQLAAYGQHLPARVAAPIELRKARFGANKPQSRERMYFEQVDRKMAQGNGHERKTTRKG